MKRLLCALVVCSLLLTRPASRAQTTLGEVAAVLPINAAKLVADPLRDRVYAAVTASNSVVVIDTTTFQTKTIAVGSEPADLSISPDGATLYVANSGSSLAAISVIDLNTLTVGSTISLPGAANTVVAGPAGRLYVKLTNSDYLFQVDTATGVAQTSFGATFFGNPLRLSSDGNMLYVEYFGLEAFDVSTAMPALLLSSNIDPNQGQFVLSHNEKYFCVPSGTNSGVTNDSTSLYSTADLTSIYGSFSSNNSPGELAFSPDDSLVYQSRFGTKSVFDVFSTQDFSEVQEVPLSAPGSTDSVYNVSSLIIERTGSYLFFTETYYGYDSSGSYGAIIATVALTTGTGPLNPPSLLPSITSSLTANGTQNAPFTYQITGSNTPTSFNATSLPDGLTVDPTTGLISGTPTSSGYFSVTISVGNASGTVAATLALDIAYDNPYSPPVITTASLPDGVAGQAYSAAISAIHSPYYYSATGLPTGLSINTSTGSIAGAPIKAGTFPVAVSATNDYGTGTATLSLTVANNPAPLPAITSALSANAIQGSPFTYQIVASNTPTSFNATGLPAGLSVDTAMGLISGIPTNADGSVSVTISASNVNGTGSAVLQLVVDGAIVPVVTTTSLPDGTVGQPYAFTVTATDAPSALNATGLPAGLSIDPASGLISGVPSTAGVFSVKITALGTFGSGNASFPLKIMANTATPPVITSALIASGAVGNPFTYRITATNSPTAYSATGLPAGLSLDPVSGVISGVPTVVGNTSILLGAVNSSGTGAATLSLTVNGAPVIAPVVGNATASGMQGVPFTFQISATSSPTSYGGNTLPAGLTLNASTGLVSGTPTVAGTFSLNITATNSAGTGTGVLNLTIAPVPVPVLSGATGSATIGQDYRYQITASNAPASFGAENLPPGLTIDTATGIISGTPTQTGTFTVNLSATNLGGTGSAALVLTVSPGLPTVEIMATVPRVTAGSGEHAVITLSRTGDLTQKLVVAYTIKGSAHNGTDYVTLSGKQKIRPNHASATIQIVPKVNGSAGTVKVLLQSAASYQMGATAKAKVKIVPP